MVSHARPRPRSCNWAAAAAVALPCTHKKLLVTPLILHMSSMASSREGCRPRVPEQRCASVMPDLRHVCEFNAHRSMPFFKLGLPQLHHPLYCHITQLYGMTFYLATLVMVQNICTSGQWTTWIHDHWSPLDRHAGKIASNLPQRLLGFACLEPGSCCGYGSSFRHQHGACQSLFVKFVNRTDRRSSPHVCPDP